MAGNRHQNAAMNAGWVLVFAALAAALIVAVVGWLTRPKQPSELDWLMAQLREDVHAVAVEVGKPLLPPLEALVEALNKFTRT